MPLLLDKKKPNLEYFDEVVNSLGLSDKLEALPNQLSGDNSRGIAIARALIYRPRCFWPMSLPVIWTEGKF